IGLIHIGPGRWAAEPEEAREFKVLDASNASGNIYVNALLNAGRFSDSTQDNPWEITLGSGNDTLTLLNSEINGIYLPNESSTLEGGEGIDTISAYGDAYVGWKNQGDTHA